MKIVRLQAENVKRLKAVEITPEGNVVKITGKNEQGKSSVLDSIILALGGPKAAKDISRPLRDGADKGYSTVNIGKYIVTRSITPHNMYLKVETADGEKVSSPQALLDELVGELSFDPFAFAQMKPEEQTKILMNLIGFDHEAYKNYIKEQEDERRVINRQIKDLEGALKTMEPVDPNVPDEEVSIDDLMKKLQDANEQKLAKQRKRDELVRMKEQKQELLAEIAELEQKLETKRKELDALQPKGEALVKEIKDMPEPDVDAIQAEINNLTETNRKIAANKKRKEMEKSLETLRNDSEKYTENIKKAKEKKDKKIQSAKLPVPGLGFDDEGVTYNGVPFMQAAASGRLRVSVAMGMAMNPNLRVILIKDASLLDSESMKVIEEMAAEHDFQVWMEVVDESGKVGVVIEDGTVKPPKTDATPADKPTRAKKAEPPATESEAAMGAYAPPEEAEQLSLDQQVEKDDEVF